MREWYNFLDLHVWRSEINSDNKNCDYHSIKSVSGTEKAGILENLQNLE